jgi:hypothetical protein
LFAHEQQRGAPVLGQAVNFPIWIDMVAAALEGDAAE